MNKKTLFHLMTLMIFSLFALPACGRSVRSTAVATAAGEIRTAVPNTPGPAYTQPLPTSLPTTPILAATDKPRLQRSAVPSDVPVLPTDDESASSVEVASHASRVLKNFTYCSVNRLALLADIYFPKNASGVGPLLIYVHGGAWSSGSKDSGSGFAEIPALLDAGYTVAAVNYRLAPNYKMPAMIEDVKCAVRSFRAHAAEYGFDPERIGVWGGSAGGHLVSMLGVADKSAGFDVGEYLEYSSRVQAVVDMFGPADLTSSDFNTQQQKNSGKNVFGTTDLANPIFAAVSPVTHITSDDPPFLILQGDIDTTVPLSQSQLFYDRLRAAGVDAQLVIVKGGPHGLGSPRQIPSRMELTQMIVKFFQKKLK